MSDAVEKLKKKALEKAYKKDSKGHPKIEEERMNFTDFLESITEPIYEVKGKGKVCPDGHRIDPKTGVCVPIGPLRTSQNPDQKELNSPASGYNVWGATGLNGDGYALEEVYQHTEKERAEMEKKEAEFKRADERMKYGRDGKPEEELRPGEVKKFNKGTGKWESNKK